VNRNRLTELIIRYPATSAYLLLCLCAVVLVLSLDLR
jgi:hypothetical protein